MKHMIRLTQPSPFCSFLCPLYFFPANKYYLTLCGVADYAKIYLMCSSYLYLWYVLWWDFPFWKKDWGIYKWSWSSNLTWVTLWHSRWHRDGYCRIFTYIIITFVGGYWLDVRVAWDIPWSITLDAIYLPTISARDPKIVHAFNPF